MPRLAPIPARPGRGLFTLSVLTVLVACNDPQPDVPMENGIESDSTGVRIVTNNALPQEWSLGVDPQVDIGGKSQVPENQLFRVNGVRVLSDGRILVANNGTGEVRVYDGSGAFVEAWGGQGEGPGEFLSLGALALNAEGDVVIWDVVRNVMTTFARSGRLVAFERAGSGFPGAPWTIDISPDGRMLVPQMQGYGIETEDGLHRRSLSFQVYDPVGDSTVDYGVWEGPEVYVETSGTTVRGAILEFGAAADGAVTPDGRIHIGAGSVPEVRTFDQTGGLTRIVRWAPGEVRAADPVVDLFRAEALERADNAEARHFVETQYASIPTGRPLPLFVSILAGDNGDLWVQEFPVPGEPDWRWKIFDVAGTLVGAVNVPAGLRLMQAGEDFVIGVRPDEFDVEHVIRYSLVRTPE